MRLLSRQKPTPAPARSRDATTPEALMAKVRRLRVVSARAVDELFGGEYHSAFRGRGIEFAEVREYQPGDDVRAIDWNVTARAGKPYIKRFEEERELTLILALDLSASGAFGTVNELKRERAAELCAVLALAATRNNDKAGMLLFAKEPELFLPPDKGVKHATRIIREAMGYAPRSRETDLPAALETLARLLRKKAIVFLVSDFLGAERDEHRIRTPLSMLARRHDVVAVTISDPAESALPRAGLLRVRDAETGEVAMVDAGSARVRREYARAAVERDEAIDRILRQSGVDRLEISTAHDYLPALHRFFRSRGRRRAR